MLQLPTLYRFGAYPCYPFLLLVVICVVLNISNDNLYVETVLLKKEVNAQRLKRKEPLRFEDSQPTRVSTSLRLSRTLRYVNITLQK